MHIPSSVRISLNEPSNRDWNFSRLKDWNTRLHQFVVHSHSPSLLLLLLPFFILLFFFWLEHVKWVHWLTVHPQLEIIKTKIEFHPSIANAIRARVSRRCFIIAVSENVEQSKFEREKKEKVSKLERGPNEHSVNKYNKEKEKKKLFFVVTIDPSGVTLIRNKKNRQKIRNPSAV